jgi:hypothetical protein
MDAADPGWRQLGAVLLEAGLLSEQDLAAALAEQQRSGRRLGEILVTRGLVSKAVLARLSDEAEPGDLPGPPERPSGTTAALPLAAVGQTTSPEQWRDHESEMEPGPPAELAHLLFAPTPGGYLLLRRSGQAPAVGEEVELPEAPTARLVVAKVARSPLPFDERVCAYLQTR